MAESASLRIGELAELAGVTARTVRHYHRIGLLAEPVRESNGYRSYQLPDAVRLLRVRRLVEMGLSLDEVADALADEAGFELREILTGLESDLATQERRVADQRRRITELLARTGDLSRSADQQGVLDELARAAGPDHPGLDRELLLADLIAGTVQPAQEPQLWDIYRQVLADPALTEEMLGPDPSLRGAGRVSPAAPRGGCARPRGGPSSGGARRLVVAGGP